MIELIKRLFVFFCLLECAYTRRILGEQVSEKYFLNVGDRIVNNESGLKIYCHEAESKYLRHIWKIMTMHLDIHSKQYTLYYGETPYEIHQKYDKNDKSVVFSDSLSFLNEFKINPFKNVCIGIYINPSNNSWYIISMTETSIDDNLFILMITGVLIFCCARILSQKSYFYYACGTLFGVTIFILILIYIIWKLVKQVKFTKLIFVGSMGIFLVHILLENAQLISNEQYAEWITWYILISSLISFMLSYRFGPVTNPRTKQITQWLLQIAGLALVYYSSYLREVSSFCCVILILLYKFLY